ncbi:MAG: PilZ domain-containing protein [Chloroflexi bacterium]|nr:PilZ domain-containing protein [Chloroflexota bacterium]
MSTERRTVQRIPADFSVRYNYEPPSLMASQTRVLDLSLAGARMECYAWLIPGASVTFHLITPEHHVVDARARVVYIESRNEPPYHVGVQFTSLDAMDRATLENELGRLHSS